MEPAGSDKVTLHFGTHGKRKELTVNICDERKAMSGSITKEEADLSATKYRVTFGACSLRTLRVAPHAWYSTEACRYAELPA